MAYDSDPRPTFDDDLEEDNGYNIYLGGGGAAAGGVNNIIINGQRVVGGYLGEGLPNNIYISGDSNSEIIINGQRIVGNNCFPRAPPAYINNEMPERFPTSVPVQCEDETSPAYESVDQRLETFNGFPSSAPVSPQELARAGFFYTGVADMVQCFICDGKVRDWELGDSAFGEHLKFFPHCEFVRRQMDA